ncbi:MAG TPA: hypothetical protein DD618_00045 [Acholeplasmatales bacterium]|nr:hypothetical protein [Acholeplasmatales bacterium]
MEQYLEKGKEVLKILINNGCEAYLIGDAVCNTILQLPFEEIEITTNATPDMVKGIFFQAKVEPEADGRVRLFYNGYEFVVSTFKAEEKHRDNRAPLRTHYSKDLHDELATRDFTISAIAMSHGGKLTDAYGGFEDIQKKRIKTIGNPRVRFSEDPIRMLRAIRLVSELGFKIHSASASAMRLRAKLLSKVSPEDMLREIKRILNGKYLKKAVAFLVGAHLHKYIPVLGPELKRLENSFKFESVDIFLACAFFKAGGFHEEWAALAADPESLQKTVELALVTPKSKYDAMILYTNGLKVCQDANLVNALRGKASKKTRKIKNEYELLPIHQEDDLKFKEKDLLELTNNQAGDYAEQIIHDMVAKILKNELANDYDALKIYAINSLRETGVLPSLSTNEDYRPETEPIKAYQSSEPVQAIQEVSEPETQASAYATQPKNPQPSFQQPPALADQQRLNNELRQSEPIISGYAELKLDQIERRIYEQEKRLQEKDAKIKELERQALQLKLDSDVNSLVGQNLEMLKDMNYFDKSTEKAAVSKELKDIYKGLITNADPKYRALKEDKDKNDKEN